MDDKFVKDVFYLGIHKINDFYDIYAALMPFINEILGLLTLTIFVPLFGLEVFPHHPKNYKQVIQRAFINVLAVTGIVANAAHYGAEYAKEVGFVKGILYAFFTFFIPNLFLYDMLLPIKSNFVRLILGFIIIYLLDITVHAISYLYIHMKDISAKKSTHTHAHPHKHYEPSKWWQSLFPNKDVKDHQQH